MIGNVLIGSYLKARIDFEPVVDGLSDCDIKFPFMNNIESILNYHYYTKQSRVTSINNNTSKDFTTHPININ
jgi:hypothetical protein